MTSSSIYAAEVFNFDVTEVEIIEEGNKFLGKNGGTATSNDGTVIKANNFEYDKLRNILIAIGDVEIDDKKENITITSQKVTYFKNKEFIFSEGQSQAISEGIIINADNFEYNKITNVIDANGDVKIDNKSENYLIYTNNATYLKNEELFLTKGQSQAINEGIIIDADNFEYNKITNIINANGDVKIKDSINDYLILANDATYYKNLEKIITNGDTEAFIQSRYIINSKDVTYLHNDKILSSQHKSKIKDQDSQVYFAEKFNYSINEEIIKGEKFLIITNYNLPKSDKFFLEDGIINLKDKKFIAKDTKIKIHKNIFDNTENDPRIKGVSSKGDENITIINKGVFTSCKKNDTCPPWSIQSDIIKHDKIKKTLNYKNAVLKIYDFPVLYLPKFFHPDPSVKRQSGLLQPEINDSNVLGSSLTLPYFKVISENKDLTLTPIWFDTDTLMSSLEYRQENKNSNFLSDFAFVNNYQSYTTKKTNSLSHLFLKYNLDLSLENFNSSDLNISINRVSNDSYLNVFDQYITKSKLRPGNFNQLTNNAVINLDHENYNFETGVLSYENLGIKKQSDRYQYVLPYYTFDKNISLNYFDGNVSFGSSGNNVLNNTNRLETNIINNITYNSFDFISNLGFKNNFGVNFKNLNSIGKKSTKYKSGMQSELISLYNMDVSLPLIKESKISKNLLTPKLSFRFNPSDMKNYSTTGRTIDANNAWVINRLGLSDTYESGRSLTLGLNYSNERKDKLNQINNYFEMKLATILRDKEERFIPNNSTLNRKHSNLFGSVTNKFSKNIEIGYNFSLDNDLNTLDYNNIDTTISLNNIVTKFNFIEENGERGDSNIVGGSIAYSLDDKNFFSFETRRNRKLNLTEFYDLVYEYKNDCLTAGIKYKKTYYSDGDLRPTQNLLFTVTLFPLTTYEYDADDLLKDENSFLNNLELSTEAFK
ncbi:organic solvent tolerance protein [Candidatus Pelagibacter sp.]|nr:organic solvent tolerance protein [Candidatus Pelagibacter sp.]